LDAFFRRYKIDRKQLGKLSCKAASRFHRIRK
jgi:hypothetical protein